MACEISQPKVTRCENRFPLQKGFAASQRPLRKFSQLRRGPLAHECHFAAKYTHFAAAKWLRGLKALKSSISQPRCHLEGCFAAVKPPFGTRVPFHSPVHSFHSCKMVAKSPYLKILQRAHHEQTCHSRTHIGHIFYHFPKFKLCILYYVLKLRKSGVQSFKRCSIWI